MRTKHTPGPWRLKRSTKFYGTDLKEYHWVGFGPIGDETPVTAPLIPENEANARLIAAAPDLLEALKYIANDDGCPPYVMELVRVAIQRAEGRSK